MKTRMIIATIACVTLAAGVVWMAVTWQANRPTDSHEPVTIQSPAQDPDNDKPPSSAQLAFDPPPTDETAEVESALVEPPGTPAGDEKTPPATPDEKTGNMADPGIRLDKTEIAEFSKSFLEQGLAALADYDLLQARSLLSAAVLSGGLTPDDDAKARDQLTQLVETTLWSTQVIEGDPYTYHYLVKSGETFARIERGEQLYVPTELLEKVNRTRATALAAGKNIKLIRGPFHAVIRKSDFTMDIYLHRDGLEQIWITRLPVGIGRGGSTPEGLFQVGDLKTGTWRPGKLVRPTWTPTESSELRGPILYGQPGYALGTKGLWIGLAGLDDRTRPLTDYALHSTDMPDSIGKEMSSGCVRLADTDIDVAWSLLYEKWSTVRIVK